MGFRLTKLYDDSYNESALTLPCSPKCDVEDAYCDGFCLPYCSLVCPEKLPPQHHTKPNKFMIAGVVLSAAFFLVFCCAVYYKFYHSRSTRRRSISQDQGNQTTHEEFLDEDHGPILDHPIWYINTVGLQPSVINSIAVCKYKRGDGLVEGTDCSVCLNEFEEDETLRLLPKCNHAFHIPCIDTWLRSHTNCPMCRAPIIVSSAAASSSEGNSESVSNNEETRIEILENDQESERELEDGNGELGSGIQEERESQDENAGEEEQEGIQPFRRSVSLDSLSAFKISQALANVCPMESDRNSRTGLAVKETESNTEIVAKRSAGGNQSLLKFMASSSIARSLQIGPSSLKRSFSCGGKLFLARYNRNSNSILPL